MCKQIVVRSCSRKNITSYMENYTKVNIFLTLVIFTTFIFLSSTWLSTLKKSGTNEILSTVESVQEKGRVYHSQDKIENLAKKLNCSLRHVELSSKPLPKIGLVSFPGSGNTWTRHLVQQMTGLATSSRYCESTLRKKGFPYECHKGNKVVLVKTHLFNKHDNVMEFDKVVLLIRNPYDAELAYLQYKLAGLNGHATLLQLKSEKGKLLTKHLKFYIDIVREVVQNFTKPIHVLQYENMRSSLAKELGLLSDFLHVNTSIKDIDCTVKLQEGNYHRQMDADSHVKLMKDVFNANDLAEINRTALAVETLLNNRFHLNVSLPNPLHPVYQ